MNDLVEKHWIMLSDKDGTDIEKLLDQADKFLIRLALKVRCHIHYFLGYDHDPHAHVVVAVPRSESKRYDQKIQKFRAWKHWRFKTLSFEPWESGHDTYGYTLGKHTPLDPKVDGAFVPRRICPKYYRACQRGECGHKY